MPASNISAFFKFDRQFGVPLDSSFVFQTTSARNSYLTDSATSGIAYTGMIVADLETNKVYMLNSNRQWQDIASSGLGDIFGASNSGIMIKTGANTFSTGGLNSGANINITNSSGILGNPTIALNSGLSGISSISGVNNFRIAANSGIVIDAGSGVVNVDDLSVSGTLYVGQGIDITTAATILARGPITYSGSPTIYRGDVYYQNTPFVGPTGGVLGTTLFPVSLSGHTHPYTDINNFCSGVSDCVNTSIVGSSGVQLIYNSGTNSLRLALSGEALAQHSITDTGFITRTGTNTYSGRTLQSGTNINITNGNGVGGNPTISLSSSITGLTNLTATDATVNNNLTIGGNLTVNGTSIIANIDTITIEDPILTLGLSSGNVVPTASFDRGLALVRATGLTAFMGWSNGDSRFIMLSSGVASANSGNYTAGTYGNLQIGELYSSYLNASGMILSADANIAGPLTVNDLGAEQLVATNIDKKLITLSVPTTGELGFLSGATSSIQTQLDNRMLKTSSVTSGNIPVWANTSGNLLNSGYGVGSVSGNNTVVLRNASGAFSAGNITANSFIRSGGTSSQFLKGDGSVDTNTYITSASIGTGLLTLGVSGSGISGSATFGANQNSGTTFTVTSNATSSNTPSTIVLRDSNGNFTATTITASGYIGSGSGLTNLNASQLTTGTIPNSRLDSVVFTTGNQIISGIKNFNEQIYVKNNLTVGIDSNGILAPNGQLFAIESNVGPGAPIFEIIKNSTFGTTFANINTITRFNTPNSSLSTPLIINPTGHLVGTAGAITQGYWRGAIIEVDKGGTGSSSYSNGQLLIGSGTSLVANTLTAGTGISIVNGAGSITINNILASTSTTGIATFSSTNFDVSAGAVVSIKTGGVTNANLVNSSLTIGATSISLGATGTAISGLTSLSATNISGTLAGNGLNITNLNASNINTGTIGISYLPTGIPITNLASSGITFGTVFSSLGSTVLTFTGLASISGTSSVSPTFLVNCSIDGGTP